LAEFLIFKTLQTSRTINGVSFNGSANITFNTDSVAEGSSNLYFTNERVDDRVDNLLVAGSGISLTYNDASNTLTIANTNDADITGVIAGNGLTGGGTSGNVTLNIDVDDSSIEIGSGALRVKNSGITNTMLAGSITNAKLSNSSVTINSQSLSLGGSLDLDTSEIPENTNLYYTSARANTDFDTRLATKDTSNVAEGSNLYYTTARANADIDSRVTKSFVDGLSIAATTAATLLNSRDISLSGDVVGSVSFNGSGNVDIATTIQANSVALGTDTVGNYIQTITGTANKITVTGSGSETAAVTLSLPDDVQIADSLTVAGNLTVNGTLTSLHTTNIDIADNLFQLNAGLTGSPVNDTGMLINRGNQDNGIFMWDESVDKFTLGLTTADGSSTGNITLSSLGTLVANVEGNVTGDVTGQVSDISNFTTANLTENTNLYYTDARVQAVSINNVVEDTTPQLGGNLASNGNDILFADNDKAIFGAGSDLQIYHDGSNSFVQDTGTGDLYLQGSSNIYFRKGNGGEVFAHFTDDGACKLRFDNSTKFQTTSSGIDVAGVITSDGLTLQTSENTVSWASGNGVIEAPSNLYLRSTGSGTIYLQDNVDVTGTATMDGLTVDGTGTLSTIGNGTQQISTYVDADEVSLLTGGSARLDLWTGGNRTMRLDANGDISFYEDTGSTAKLFWDASAESLGIGTSSPSSVLETFGGTSFIGAKFKGYSGGKTALVGGDLNTVWFGDDDGSIGLTNSFKIRGASNTATIVTNSETRMTVDGSGNLLVGKLGADNTTAGTTIYGGIAPGAASFVRDAGNTLVLNRLTNDGEIVAFRKDGTTVGSISTFDGEASFGRNNTGIMPVGSGSFPRVIPTDHNSNVISDGAIDLGYNNARWKDLYLSGGVHLGGTGSANKLDDYEEGNWTPAISGATHTVQQGFYTKVGDLVFFKLRISWSAYNNAAGGVLTGLPFTADAAIESMGVNVYVNSGFGSIPSGKGYLNAFVAANNTTLNFNWQPNTAVAEFASSGNIYVAGTYLT